MKRVLATALQKGGVGKTTMAISIAAELAKKGRTVLIDADPQGNATGALLSQYECEFADVLQGTVKLENAIHKTCVENLFIIPTASLDYQEKGLNKLRSYKSKSASNEPFAIDDMVKALSDSFDYCIFDTSPAFDAFEENIFYACDEVIAVMQADVFSNDGITIFGENIQDFKKRKRAETKPVFNKIILNSYDGRLAYHHAMKETLNNQSKFQIFIVPTDQAFKRSQNAQKPIQLLQNDAKVETLKAIENIAQNLI